MTEFVTIPAAVFDKLCAAWEFQQTCNQPGSNALETGASRDAHEWLHETVEGVIENAHPCTLHHEQRETHGERK